MSGPSTSVIAAPDSRSVAILSVTFESPRLGTCFIDGQFMYNSLSSFYVQGALLIKTYKISCMPLIIHLNQTPIYGLYTPG